MDLQGRGIWIWRLTNKQKYNPKRLLQDCLLYNISFLAIKAGDQGKNWSQFNSSLISTLKKGGIKVLGWSYDTPDKLASQTSVIERVISLGADGFIIDAETEWDKESTEKTIEYGKRIQDLDLPEDFILGDAPWDVPHYHKEFPFEEFGDFVQFRSPQVYWIAHGISVEKSTRRYHEAWGEYENQLPIPKIPRPHFPSGSLWETKASKLHPSQIEYFENYIKNIMGCKGCLYWEWSQIPKLIWDYLKEHPF